MASDPFLHSLQMNDGDLVFANNGFTEIGGVANLTQALTLCILTPYGSDIFNTSYGLDITQAFLVPNTPTVVKQIIKLNLVRTLSMDPRVKDVRSIVFVGDPDYIDLHPELAGAAPGLIQQQKLTREWQVEIMIDTMNSQTQTLTATIGA